MTRINRTVIVPDSASVLFNLVLDVESYPKFLPWCGGAYVSEQTKHTQLATIKIAKGPLKTQFTTRNDLTENEEIKLALIEGPFKRLDGVWRFKTLSDGNCKVELNMQFDFAAGPIGMLLKPVFTAICDSLLDAFVQRAESLRQHDDHAC